MSRSRRRLLLVALGVVAAAAGVYLLWPIDSRLREAERAAAARDFDRALGLIGDTPEAVGGSRDRLLFAARTARRAGRLLQADALLRQYATAGGDAETAAVERILIGMQRDDVAALEGGLRFCEKDPGHPAVPFVLEAVAEGQLKRGHLNGATAAATRWLESNPPQADAARAHVIRGTCYREIGNLDLAAAEARSALALVPNDVDAHALAGQALAGRDPSAALEHFATVLAARPDDADARLGSARCHRNRGEPDLARADLDRLLTKSPDHVSGLVERAKLRIDAGEYPAAEDDLKKATAAAPRSRDALGTLARVYQLTNRPAEAEAARAKVKTIEAELFTEIRRRVAAGLIPAPPPGTDLTTGAGP